VERFWRRSPFRQELLKDKFDVQALMSTTPQDAELLRPVLERIEGELAKLDEAERRAAELRGYQPCELTRYYARKYNVPEVK